MSRLLAALRGHPFVLAAAALVLLLWHTVLNWFIDPIVRLNVERWAEPKGADKMLSDGAPDGVMEQLVYYYYAYVVPGFMPYMLGVVTCAVLFGTYDIWVGANVVAHCTMILQRRRRRAVTASQRSARD